MTRHDRRQYVDVLLGEQRITRVALGRARTAGPGGLQAVPLQLGRKEYVMSNQARVGPSGGVYIDTAGALAGLAKAMRYNSARWFPQLHDGSVDLVTFYTLGMCGEVGEVANEVKKIIRNQAGGRRADLGSELADVFTYLLLLADELGVDLMAEYDAKVVVNEERWGA